MRATTAQAQIQFTVRLVVAFVGAGELKLKLKLEGRAKQRKAKQICQRSFGLEGPRQLVANELTSSAKESERERQRQWQPVRLLFLSTRLLRPQPVRQWKRPDRLAATVSPAKLPY